MDADKNLMDNFLSTDLEMPSAVPYFLWDEPMTVAELKRRLAEASAAERMRLLSKILREARDTDVWKFTTPEEVAAQVERTCAATRTTARVLGILATALAQGEIDWRKRGLTIYKKNF